LDHDNERFVSITDALADKLTEAFELVMVFEKEVRSAAVLREGAHRIAVDASCLRVRVNRLQDDLVDKKSGSD
jgi:hypothetical protein